MTSFFNEIKSGDYELYISNVVLREIEQANELLKNKLITLVNSFNPVLLMHDLVAERLAFEYINDEVLTVKSIGDCRHAAIATVNGLDVLLSWNMKHLANYNRMRKINEVNSKNGYYKQLQLLTPLEIAEYEKD